MACCVALASAMAATPATPRHTELSETLPEAGTEQLDPVRQIVLSFTTAVAGPLSTISVVGPRGPVATSAVAHPPDREDQIRVEFAAPLPSGAYDVDWTTVAPDGHVLEGSFTFAVVGAEPVSVPVEASAEGDTTESRVAVADDSSVREAASTGVPAGTHGRALQLIGAVLLLGVGAVRFAVLPWLGRGSALPELHARMLGGLRNAGWVGAGLFLVSLPWLLALQLAAIGDVGPGGTSFLLFQTAWGGGWFLHVLAAVLALSGLALSGRGGGRAQGWAILGVAVFLIPLAMSLQGHAWGAEGNRSLAVLSLYLHVLGAGAWLGGLALLLLIGLPALRNEPTVPLDEAGKPTGRPPIARLVNAFSRVALPAVSVLVLSGVVNAWIQLGGVGPLFGSTYGRTLMLKLAVVAGALLLGFYNWRRIRPSLVTRPDASALRIPASLEATLGLVVLILTAVLVATPTP